MLLTSATLRRFVTTACTAITEGLPPSFGQHVLTKPRLQDTLANVKCTDLHCVREPFPPYQPKPPQRATVMAQGYPPLTSNPNTPWRKIPWFNLRGYWLAQAGFRIGPRFHINIEHNKITLTVDE